MDKQHKFLPTDVTSSKSSGDSIIEHQACNYSRKETASRNEAVQNYMSVCLIWSQNINYVSIK